MKSKYILTAILAGLLVVGCASSGNKVLKQETEQSIQQKIRKGVTTKSKIREMFGSPLTTTFTDSGKEMWRYEFVTETLDAVNFIPVVNWFGGSSHGVRKELVILFNNHDKVANFSMSESEVKTGTGIFK